MQAVCLLVLASSTACSNIAANVVGPAMDFSNMAPRWLNFRRGQDTRKKGWGAWGVIL